MRRTTIAAVIAVVAVALSGCGDDEQELQGSPADLPAASSSAPAPSSSAPAARTNGNGVELTSRGNIPKELGEEAGLGDPSNPSGQWLLTFAVDAITPDPECTSGFADPPANGHYIAVDLRATTSPNLPPDAYVQFTSDYFTIIGPDGVTRDSLGGKGYSCLADSDLFTYDALGPGQQYVGKVVLDSPVPSGLLIYTPPGGTEGWEWEF